MAPRQTFDELLNSSHSGPSTPRGRGFQGARGARGARGGGSARGGTPGTGKRQTDYSNVPFNYDSINKASYVRLEGFSVSPYGKGTTGQVHSASHSPTTCAQNRGRGSLLSRGRGRGQGFPSPLHSTGRNFDFHSTVHSGSATPVSGLGYHKEQHVERALSNTRGAPTWGGGHAPLFVKAGDLFKDGVVEVITIDRSNQELQTTNIPLNDPSAPQMTDLTHDTEVEVLSTERSSMQEVSDEVDNCVKNFESLGEGTQASLEAEPDTPRPELSDVQNDRPLFFVDTDPSLDDKELSGPSYEAVSAEPLGSSASQQSDEETIVFLPRTYRHPQSISILNPNPVTSPSPIKPSPIILPAIEQRPRNKVSIRSGPAQRKEKHSTKCDTRGRKKKSRRHRVIEGSDIEWGSDGPPGMILGVEGENDGGGSEDNEEAGEDSMAVLRDYLEGTLLNAKSEWREREERIGSEKDSEASEHRARELKTRSEERGEKGEEFIGELVGEQDMEVEASEDSEGDWESSSDSRGPPDQADIKSALEAADTGSDEDMEKEAGFFAGRNSWGDTNWFIRNMEEALDEIPTDMNDRRERQQRFTAIENGNFDDFWPTEPAKKGKNKLVPPELQSQWERDRQKKAAKKRQRDLDRLAAALDPYPASRKAKGKSKAHQASLAHLIPASAAEVADMFDISSDEENMIPPRGRMAFLPKPMEQYDEDIRAFLELDGKNTFSLPPMGKEGRMKIHMLAECYGLTSKSRGKGQSRFTILIKNSRSGVVINESKIHRLLSASKYPGGGFFKALHSRPGASGKSKKLIPGRSGGGGGGGGGVRHREGDQVGDGAERIGGDNVGHKLLSRMGWAEGDRIGRSGGLDNPIVAIVKNTKMGLGA